MNQTLSQVPNSVRGSRHSHKFNVGRHRQRRTVQLAPVQYDCKMDLVTDDQSNFVYLRPVLCRAIEVSTVYLGYECAWLPVICMDETSSDPILGYCILHVLFILYLCHVPSYLRTNQHAKVGNNY